MNFFAHAVIAAARSKDPEFVLGAMLPDFASMLRTRVALAPSALEAGVKFHQRTDELFHTSAEFLDWQARATRTLIENGMRRGPARAVAHVGVELLLDLALVERLDEIGAAEAEHAWQGYRQALERGQLPLPAANFSGTADADRLRDLCAKLAQGDVQHFRGSPERAIDRLERVLRGRPRLELIPPEVQTAKQWSLEALNDVRQGLQALLTGLEKRLWLEIRWTGPLLEGSAPDE